MYKRSKKDEYRKRIEEMIGGSQKRVRGSSNSNNITTNIRHDITSVIDNGSNDDVINIDPSDISNSSSGINDNAKNDELDINKIRVQKWNSVSTRVEGIRNI
jgi:hypothetical protein